MTEDFYIGYLPKTPGSLGRWIARIVAALMVAGLAIGACLIFGQAPFADSGFEYGIYREYTGVIEEWPYPILRTANSSVLLVAPGKHGLSREVAGLQGKSVRLRGSLIERGPDRMIEVLPDSLHETAAGLSQTAPGLTELGSVRLRGEIVDSKCYLGVMNPGNGKVHRDCAVRCISGGAPPAIIARDEAGATRILLLVGSDGRALNKEILSFVAEPLEVSGKLVRAGSNLVLKVEPADFRRE